MVAGQCVDISGNEDYGIEYLQLKKTSALLKCGLCVGAALGGADKAMLDALSVYADNVGLAFQITDDILDVIGDSTLIGKSVGKDSQQNKRTFTAKYGVEGSRRIARDYVDRALVAISDLDGKEFLTEFASRILNRDR
jgi:geranylgeranyl diphosphate synthase type II